MSHSSQAIIFINKKQCSSAAVTKLDAWTKARYELHEAKADLNCAETENEKAKARKAVDKAGDVLEKTCDDFHKAHYLN